MAGIAQDVINAIGYADGASWDPGTPAEANAEYNADYERAQEVMSEGPSEPFNALAWSDLPPEVAQLLGPGVDPFASLNGAAAVTPTSPTGIGLAPGVPALAPAPYPNTIVVSTQPLGIQPGGVMPVLPEWGMIGTYPLGRIVFETIENRQSGGVRFGTAPMVVFQDNSGRGPN